MAYVRGHRGDYDRWAASGLLGWSYADVLPYFRRQESWEGGANAYRGGENDTENFSPHASRGIIIGIKFAQHWHSPLAVRHAISASKAAEIALAALLRLRFFSHEL